MKIKSILIILLFMLCAGVSAQTLSPVVISSSGAFTSNGTAMLSSTVGEMTMVATFSSAGGILTQGFQQPEDFGVSISSIESKNEPVVLGPNPTKGNLSILLDDAETLQLSISMIDMLGKIIFHGEIEKQVGNNMVNLDFSHLACGEYILNCRVSGKQNDMPIHFSKKISIVY